MLTSCDETQEEGVKIYILLYKEIEMAVGGIQSFKCKTHLESSHPNIMVRHVFVVSSSKIYYMLYVYILMYWGVIFTCCSTFGFDTIGFFMFYFGLCFYNLY